MFLYKKQGKEEKSADFLILENYFIDGAGDSVFLSFTEQIFLAYG